MGPSVYGGTGRLPLLSSFLANHLRSQETRYILSSFLTIPLKVNQSQKTFESLFEIWNLLRIDTTAQRRVNPELW